MIITEKPHLKENKNWRELYHCLKRKFGLRDEFTELVMLCKLCRSIYGIQSNQSNTVSYILCLFQGTVLVLLRSSLYGRVAGPMYSYHTQNFPNIFLSVK